MGSRVHRRAASQEVLEQVVCVGLTVSENLGREQMQQLCHTNSYERIEADRTGMCGLHVACLPVLQPFHWVAQ